MTPSNPRPLGSILFAAVAAAALVQVLASGPAVGGGLLAYAFLAVGPGAALFLLLAPRLSRPELAFAALSASPVLVVLVGAPLLLAGIGADRAAAVVIVLVAAAGLWALRPGRPSADASPWPAARLWVLAATLLGICVLIGVLPVTQTWWRMRADSWFHAAVVAQIADFGLPPQDPYFVGLPLQYMWLYHVLVLVLSRASGIGPLGVMPLLNFQAICTFALGAFLVSSVFRKGFAAPYWSLLAVVFGMNAFFWVFLPVIILLRAFTGEVQGMAEVTRLLTIEPFSADQVRQLLHIYFNQEFLLDKFMVGTALSLGLGFMAALWYGTVRHLERPRRRYPVLVFLASVGVIGFHPLTGILAVGGILGGLFFLFLMRRRVEGYRLRPSVAVAAAVVAAGLLLLPYVFSITHAKEGEQLLPFSLSIQKLAGLVISLAFVLFLSAFQVRKLARERSVGASYLIAATLALLVISLVIRLPGPNTYDKLPFLLFFPLAVVAGWTLAGWAGRGTGARRAARAILVFLVAFAPLNGLALAAYYNSPPQPALDPPEEALAEWARVHTPRDAIFFDSEDRVIMLVAGPRRYWWGVANYADQWGYDAGEVARRRHVRDNLYAPAPLDSVTTAALGAMPDPVYVIVRGGEPGAAGPEKFTAYPSLFDVVFSTGDLFLFQVDRAACRSASRDPASAGRSERTEGP